jgi:triosephosphate isomerase
MKILAGNWKLNKSPAQTKSYFESWLKLPAFNSLEVVFFPPMTSLESTAQLLNQSVYAWGAQNCCHSAAGAFTGETSAQVLREMGARWVLIGHSERRKIFGEKDELIARKLNLAQDLGLRVMLCVGETLEEREANKTSVVLEAQLQIGLQGADRKKPLVIAYEPVWAIGTGKVASVTQVAETHSFIRQRLEQMGFLPPTPLLYGGSVNAENAKDLICLPAVDGFLVGGASLEVSSMQKIALSMTS